MSHAPPRRRHLNRATRVTGRGLFGGGPATVTLRPGTPGAGWRWAADRGEFGPLGPANWVPLPHRSSLEADDGATVQLCEHVLAAAVLCGLDDLDIRFEGGEAPILDGSAQPFVRAMQLAGFSGPPSPDPLEVSVTWRGQRVEWGGGGEPALARTFIDRDPGASMLASGQFPGARPGCAVVFDDDGSVRFGRRPRLRSEPAWHKLVDLLGDLGPYRARGRLRGRIEAVDPSHATNGDLIRAALDDGQLECLQDSPGAEPGSPG